MSYSHGNHDFVDFTQFIDIEERVLRNCMNNSDHIAIIDMDCQSTLSHVLETGGKIVIPKNIKLEFS